MDAFFASVEQLDHPALRNKAIAVGGSAQRGVVAAASYEARKYGVKSAMPSITASRLCPHLIFVKPRFQRYKEISKQIRDIFYDYTDLVEPLSLDEAFLDVTENKKNNPSASLLAQEIRQRIKSELGLNASAGISINKFLAKVASDINKPNGQKTINPDETDDFLENLAINKFYGIGKVTAEKMHKLGIYKGRDLKQFTRDSLTKKFGKSGAHYYNIVRGIHESPVTPNRIRKSLAAERTFIEDRKDENFIINKLHNIAEELESRIKRSDVKGKTITLKIKYSDFSQQTRSKTVNQWLSKKDEFFPIIEALLQQEALNDNVRLLGISLSNLNNQIAKEQKFYSVQLKIDFEEFKD